MFKIFKKISLLTIFLSLILCFNATKTKAYYDLDTSYINVYVNGKLLYTYPLLQEYPFDTITIDKTILYTNNEQSLYVYNKNMIIKALRVAFPATIPILTGFGFLGLTYGIYMNASGFSFIYAS